MSSPTPDREAETNAVESGEQPSIPCDRCGWRAGGFKDGYDDGVQWVEWWVYRCAQCGWTTE